MIFNDNGSVSINTEGLSDYQLNKDKGLALLNDMVNNSDKKFFYENSDDISSVMDDGLQHSMGELDRGIVNASNNGLDSKDSYTHKPKAGYDGHVILAKSGLWKTTDGKDLKTSILFHELAENYYRTHEGLNYKPAHEKAISREGFHYKNTTPGRFYGNVIYWYKGVRAEWCMDR